MSRIVTPRVSRRAASTLALLLSVIVFAAPPYLPAQGSTQVSQLAPMTEPMPHSRISATRPMIAIIGDTSGVEITDFLVPRAVLAESGVAQVVVVAASKGKIRLMQSTLTIDADMTFAAFDAAYPHGADYIIVPAMLDPENAAVRAWLQTQAAQGATIVSICEGARVVAGAGLFDGRRATTHWHALDDVEKKFPRTTWVRNSRYVIDDHRISTTGVSASLPVSLLLIERIAGRPAADSAARRLGINSWDSQHETDAFQLTKWMYVKAATNYFAWWRHDLVAVPVSDGVDEVALALTMDAIPRTMRATALTWSELGGSMVGRQGLRISVDRSRASLERSARQFALPGPSVAPSAALDSAMVRLGSWYGADAPELIRIGMEYPARPAR